MNAAVKPGKGLQQTQLAHIGHINTADGRFEVAIQRLVLTGMLAPRGQTRLVLLTPNGTLADQFWYPCFECTPLWCEGGRIYLFGFAYVPGIPIDPEIAAQFRDEVATGNVIDFSEGLDRAVLRRESRYGSSRGVDAVPSITSEETQLGP
jgi:hypothetical protein